jgi:hypothetical protein
MGMRAAWVRVKSSTNLPSVTASGHSMGMTRWVRVPRMLDTMDCRGRRPAGDQRGSAPGQDVDEERPWPSICATGAS